MFSVSTSVPAPDCDQTLPPCEMPLWGSTRLECFLPLPERLLQESEEKEASWDSAGGVTKSPDEPRKIKQISMWC